MQGINKLGCRRFSSVAKRLEFHNFGNPADVLQLKEFPIAPLKPDEILVKMLASPINPADINIIQNVYGIKQTLPAVGGNEGVGIVTEVGSNVKNIRQTDWIIPVALNTGTWTNFAVWKEAEVLKLKADKLDLTTAATLKVNPPTAYRMLTDFVQLNPGDSVIQNGANSNVGQSVIQIAKVKGFKTINLVRNKPDLKELKAELIGLGADVVLTEEELKGSVGKELWKSFPRPKLALNCVGGKSGVYLAVNLANKGKLVTYGGMSKMPLSVPTGPLIFNDISLHGYWMSRWYSQPENNRKRDLMIDFLVDLASQGHLKAPRMQQNDFETEYLKAVTQATEGTGLKQLLVFK